MEVFPMPTRRYTIRELADELHVTKPGIRKLMTDSFRKQYTETEGNRILINSAGARVIRKHFRRYKNDNKSKTETKTKNSSQKQKRNCFRYCYKHCYIGKTRNNRYAKRTA